MLKRAFLFPREMSALEIRGKMIEKGVALFPSAWKKFLDKKARMPDLSGGKRWPPRSAVDGEIGEYWSEEMVRNIVRALCPPWPSAYIGPKRVSFLSLESFWIGSAIPYPI